MRSLILAACLLAPMSVWGVPRLDPELLGESLGGWNAKRGDAAEYTITGVDFRTWKPHVTPTADGGLFVSVRIDHRRGFLASDDHASLELSFDREGGILSARSTIALQGRRITSDVVKGASNLGASTNAADRIVTMGAELVADLTTKLLREKVNEPGRVGFPAALQHNYHLVCLAVGEGSRKAVVVNPEPAESPTPETTTDQAPSSESSESPEGAPEVPGPDADQVREVPPLKIEEPGKPKPVKK